MIGLRKEYNLCNRFNILFHANSLWMKLGSLSRQVQNPVLYPIIIGEHGTGKTTLINLAIGSLNGPEGIIYVDVPVEDDSPIHLTKAMQEALAWNPDPENIDKRD